MTTTRQLGFAFGQIGKAGYARVDQNFYALGLRQLRNATVSREGIASRRAGTIFCGETIDSTYRTRVFPFIFSPDPDQAYALAFSNLTMRVYRNREPVTETVKNITGATQANPCELTVVAHGLATGDHVYVTRGSVVGMKQLNGREYIITSTGDNTFTLKSVSGVNVNSTAFAAYVPGGTVGRVYKITTPYTEAELDRLTLVQSADVVKLFHPSHRINELVRTGHAAWTLSEMIVGSSVGRSGLFHSVAGGPFSADYKLTAVDAAGHEGGAALCSPTLAISAITKANPAKVTVAANIYATGDEVMIVGGDMVELNNRVFRVTFVDGTHFTLNDVDSTSYTTYTAGANVVSLARRVTGNSLPVILSWTGVPGAISYRLYRADFTLQNWGLLAETGNLTFSDPGTVGAPDQTETPPIEFDRFMDTGQRPGCGTYYQQRLVTGGASDTPETIAGSRVGDFNDFSKHSPGQDDDALNFSTVGRQVNEVRHLLGLDKLIILTSGSELAALGDGNGTLTPTQTGLRPIGYNGASYVVPVVADNVILFIQERDGMLRGMTFDPLGRYEGFDFSLPSSDLFEGHTIVEMAYQKTPDSILWLVRDDGVLLSFTFVAEHGIKGWAIHDTDGLVESVCCIPETGRDAVYVVVKRDLPGSTGRRYVEVLAPERTADVADYVGMDSCRTYDGRHRNDGVNVRIKNGVTWAAGEVLTVEASGGTQFHADDVGSSVFVYLTEADHGIKLKIQCEIISYVDATNVTVRANYNIPVSAQTVYVVNWDLAAITIYELWHLEGMTLSVLRDGGVYASPNNDSLSTVATVANGKLTLSKPGGVVAAGLPFIPAAETLNIDTVNGESIIGKKKHIKSVHVFVKDTRAVWGGPKPPTDPETDPLEELEEYTPANVDDEVDEPPPLATDVIRIRLQSQWNSNGRVFLCSVDPLPWSILAIAPSGVIPLRG